MITFTIEPPTNPSWYVETIHTKAVRGMQKTEDRRPFRHDCDGRKTKSQRYWMLHRPTLDVLWFRQNARKLDLAINRQAKG